MRNAPGFAVNFDEYDHKQQKITGDCSHFNRAEALTYVKHGVEYFAFDVPPGYYAYSAFNVPPGFPDPFLAFEVPPNKINYLGDFIFDGYRVINFKRPDPNEVRVAIEKNTLY